MGAIQPRQQPRYTSFFFFFSFRKYRVFSSLLIHLVADVQKTSLVSYQTRRLLVERVPQLFWVLVLILKAARTTWQKPRSLLAATLYFALWFPGILLVEALKVRSSDMHCSTRLAGNGISGHFFYFAWALASMILLQREIPTPVVPSFAILASLFAVQGYYTWAFGYHSLQQIFLGAGFGLLFASICWITAHKVIGKDNQ